MRRFTINEKVNGELACRSLSEKAKDFYNGCSPLDVYEYEDNEGNKLYAYDGVLGPSYDLSFEELNEVFEELNEEFENLED